MKNKQIAFKAILLVIVFSFLISIVGCDKTKGVPEQTTSSPKPGSQSVQDEKPVLPLYTVQVMGIGNPTDYKKSDETDTGRMVKDKFNVVFEYVPYTGDYKEKLNLMLAAGDYPEMLFIQSEEMVRKYIQAGALIALDDYIKDMPNFVERNKDIIPYWRLSSPDKKLYKWEGSVPQDIKTAIPFQVLDISVRTDALEKQGWPTLINTEQWIDFLKQALKDFPETDGQPTIGMVVPFAEPWGVAGLSGNMYEKGGPYVPIANAGVLFNQETKQFDHYFLNKYVKEGLQFFNRLYREGILDKECFTDFHDQVYEKMITGRPISMYYCNWLNPSVNQEMVKLGHPERQYIMLPIASMTQYNNKEKRQLRMETTRAAESFAVTKNAKDPKRLTEMMDWAATEEGQLIINGNVEGKTYTLQDGVRVPTQEYLDYLKGKNDDFRTVSCDMFFLGRCNQLAADGMAYNISLDVDIYDNINLTERQFEAFNKLGWSTSFDYWKEMSVPSYTGLAGTVSVDPNSSEGMIEAKMVELRVKTSTQLIMAESDEEFEEIYKNAIESYNKLNPDVVVNKYNELYQESVNRLEECKKIEIK
jgi:putative aldouronate transport system substrate-binding protein